MPQTEEEYQRTYRSEQSRGAILFFAASIVFAIRESLHSDAFWNFPCNSPCSHITLFLLPTITNWLISMAGYAICMFIYFSEDRFDRPVRDFVRRVGYLFVWWFPVTVIIFSVFGGLSYQLPDWAQLPYWLSVFAVFSFYLIWTVEGTTGRKILGKRSVLDKPTEAFLEVSREGAQVIADTLVHIWKGVQARLLRHPATTKISTRRTTWVFVTIIELITISIAYFVLNLSGFDLLYAFGVPLYVLIFASAIIGLLKKRERKTV